MLVMSCKLSLGSSHSNLRVCQLCIRLPKNDRPPATHNICFRQNNCAVYTALQTPNQPAYWQTSTRWSSKQGSPVKLVSETFNSLLFEHQIFLSMLQSCLQLLHTGFKTFCLHLRQVPCPVKACKAGCKSKYLCNNLHLMLAQALKGHHCQRKLPRCT